VQTAKGPIEITRVMTPCAKNKGWLQPLVPVAGVTPVTEIEMLNAMNDQDALLVDMRESEDRIKGTIPGSYHIPYTEVSGRMDELGCKKVDKAGAKGWDCSGAKKVYAFCNGPVCPQSPTAILAMTRDGFPASKIYYYRGGMLDWDALGFPVIKGDF
jgi:rhodanese-related sulfurtransferase